MCLQEHGHLSADMCQVPCTLSSSAAKAAQRCVLLVPCTHHARHVLRFFQLLHICSTMATFLRASSDSGCAGPSSFT